MEKVWSTHFFHRSTAVMPVHFNFISSRACTCSPHKCVTGIQRTRFMVWLVCSSFDYWKGIGQAENTAALLLCAVRKPWHCMLWNQTVTPGTSDPAPHHAGHSVLKPGHTGCQLTAQMPREGQSCHTQGDLLLPTASKTAPEESAASGIGHYFNSVGTLRFWTHTTTNHSKISYVSRSMVL